MIFLRKTINGNPQMQGQPVLLHPPVVQPYIASVVEANPTLFKKPHKLLQNTTQPSSKYHTTLFKVPHHPLQNTTQPSSK